jgi:thiamine kinase-like enzyme
MNITDLGGHSGCSILLCETEDNLVFVRKISGSIGYNERLESQAKKQSEFRSEFVKAPRIISTGYKDGLFYFDMEYIAGITLAKYMNTIQIGRVRGLVDSIVRSIVASRNGQLEAKEDIFKKKIKSLTDNLKRNENKTVSRALKLLNNHNWSRFTRTFCHGDLTLENVIVKDGQLYYIDFLDSFYDSWLMDISTLMQDVQTMWSYRFNEEQNINTLLRLIVFRDILMDKVKEMVGSEYIEVYYALLLKLIRIYPYTSDERTLSFLDEKVKSVMTIIEEKAV